MRAKMEQVQKDVREKAYQLEQEKAELQSDHLLAIERLRTQVLKVFADRRPQFML